MALKTCIGFCIVSTLFLVGFLGCETPQSSVTGSGIVEATDIIISAVLAEEITMLDVNEGDTVSAGQIIARQDKQALELERAATEAMRSEIDALEIQATAKVSHAQTALKGAEKDYKRALSLKQKGSIPQQQFDQVETAYELAQEQLRMAKSVFQSFDARRKTVQAKLDLIDYRISKT